MAVHQGGASAGLTVEVDTKDFRTLFSRSSEVAPKLRTALRRNIRSAAKGVAEEVKAEAMQPGMGVEHRSLFGLRRRYAAGSGRSTGLRAGIAASVKVGILTGASRQGVRITESAPLGAAWQSARGWRHPTFGDREAWVQQKGHPGYFYRTISAGAPRVQKAVESAMSEAVQSLGGAS